jgi:hypothetical protein
MWGEKKNKSGSGRRGREARFGGEEAAENG